MFFFAGLRAAFLNSKNDFRLVQMAKSKTLICLVLLSLLRPHVRGVGAD